MLAITKCPGHAVFPPFHHTWVRVTFLSVYRSSRVVGAEPVELTKPLPAAACEGLEEQEHVLTQRTHWTVQALCPQGRATALWSAHGLQRETRGKSFRSNLKT